MENVKDCEGLVKMTVTGMLCVVQDRETRRWKRPQAWQFVPCTWVLICILREQCVSLAYTRTLTLGNRPKIKRGAWVFGLGICTASKGLFPVGQPRASFLRDVSPILDRPACYLCVDVYDVVKGVYVRPIEMK